MTDVTSTILVTTDNQRLSVTLRDGKALYDVHRDDSGDWTQIESVEHPDDMAPVVDDELQFAAQDDFTVRNADQPFFS